MPEPSYANVSSDFELALPIFWVSHCFSTAQSCPILCDPMDCSSPGSCSSLPPGVCSNSCPLNWWCHPSVSSFVMPFSPLLQSFLASGSFSKSWLFTSHGQSVGPSASASVLSMNTQGWFSLAKRTEGPRDAWWDSGRPLWIPACRQLGAEFPFPTLNLQDSASWPLRHH